MHVGFINVQLIAVIHRFFICKFSYSLRFTCHPKINAFSIFMAIHGHAQNSKKIELPYTLPTEVKQVESPLP